MRLICTDPKRLITIECEFIDSIQPLLLEAVEELEQYLANVPNEPASTWLEGFVQCCEAVDQLAVLWVNVEQPYLLSHPGSHADESLRHPIVQGGRRLLYFCGLLQLQTGGLLRDPDALTPGLIAECRILAWRLVAAVLVQHALCSLWRCGQSSTRPVC